MYDLFIIWIALVLLIAVGTFLSTRLYTRFGKGNQVRGNRLNTLESMLYQQWRTVLLYKSRSCGYVYSCQFSNTERGATWHLFQYFCMPSDGMTFCFSSAPHTVLTLPVAVSLFPLVWTSS